MTDMTADEIMQVAENCDAYGVEYAPKLLREYAKLISKKEEICGWCQGSGVFCPNGIRHQPCHMCHPKGKTNPLLWIMEASAAIDKAYGPQAQLTKEAQEVFYKVYSLIISSENFCDLMPGLAGGPEFDAMVNALKDIGHLS